MAFSPDGERVLACGADGVLRAWDLASGEPVATRAPPRASDAEAGKQGRAFS